MQSSSLDTNTNHPLSLSSEDGSQSPTISQAHSTSSCTMEFPYSKDNLDTLWQAALLVEEQSEVTSPSSSSSTCSSQSFLPSASMLIYRLRNEKRLRASKGSTAPYQLGMSQKVKKFSLDYFESHIIQRQ